MKCAIEMNRRFLRSVNIGRDRSSKEGLEGYVLTPSVRTALARVLSAFTEKVTERAFTLTGPYGTGKSSFGLFLWHLLSDRKDPAWKMLQKVDAKLAASFMSAVWGRKDGKGYAALTLTARRAPVAELLADAFEFSGIKASDAMSRDINALRASRDTKQSMRLLQTCIGHLSKMGYRGVLIVFDELGKVFEEAQSGKTDAFLLQEVAEAASRSSKTPLIFMGMLHQSIADYAARDTTARNEFGKIEGRFEPITFTEPVAAQIHLAAEAFPEGNPYSKDKDAAKLIKGAIADVNLASLVGLRSQEFAAYATRALPLHPMTLAALPLLFRRLGQNERSIFTFLTGNETKGLHDFVKRAKDGELFRLCDLYDYFFENYEASLSGHTFGHPFLEAHATIQAKISLPEKEVELLKTIAVLTSLGLQSPIHANKDLIAAAMAPVKLADELDRLQGQSILVYRKFNKTYALWSGSDIDIQECCEEADKELQKEHFSIAETFKKFVPPMPVVAKRHTISKGSLRYFDVVYIDEPSMVSRLKKPVESNAAGLLVVCLTDLPKWQNWFTSEAIDVTRGDPSLVFAIPSDIADLTDALLEIRRLNWVEQNERKLRDDRIASRELAIRLAVATQAVAQHQHGILDPRPANQGGGGCVYVRGGSERKLANTREVSAMLSDVCDELYPQAPILKNELINKRLPSSQAAAARRLVINALNNPEAVEKERLGIEGFPPERSIYESVIAASGIHRMQNGKGGLFAPRANAPTNLLPAWKKIEELVFADRQDPLSVKALLQKMAKPPYGVLEGLTPILLAAFYAVNRDEVSLYQEGTFLDNPEEAHFELMLRRPDLFAISGMRITGLRQRVVERLARGLGVEPKLLPVVRKLYVMMRPLSKYARETNAVSDRTMKFRDAFFGARSPEKMLFVDLPVAFGLKPIEDRNGDVRQFDEFFNCLNASTSELALALPKLVDEHRRHLLTVCGFEPTSEGWKDLYDKSSFLLARIGGEEICPFLQNVVNTQGDWDKADQVMAYIKKSPMANWGTMQIEEFKKDAQRISELFLAACRSFDRAGGVLSKREQKQADDLAAEFRKRWGKSSPGIRRAALLACLRELEGQK